MLKKVLIVDDSKMVHQMYRIILMRYEDCELLCATDGREGLGMLGNHPDVDMVLLDMNMPQMNGCEFITAMREAVSDREIPVVVISAKPREECNLEGLAHRIKGYINKRYAAEGIHDIIRDLFPAAA